MELRHIEAAKDYCGDEEYRNITARILCKAYESSIRNKRELHKKVNKYLIVHGMREISYDFVVKHSSLS
ncbi:hypothetical protein MKX29_01525 [Cytobacillus sp. FSL R7-0696]|uniref:hypothetical protein n=1 Tax=Cytobacillus sp. FSL R7-0696 TaxID=2921691 RepID=UPI0030F67429